MTVVAVRMTHNGAPSRLLSDTHDMKPSKKYEASPAAQVRGFERSEPAATKKNRRQQHTSLIGVHLKPNALIRRTLWMWTGKYGKESSTLNAVVLYNIFF